jgi:hypothetical protein
MIPSGRLLLRWLINQKRIFWSWPVDLDWNRTDYLKYPILPLILSFSILFAIVLDLTGFNTHPQSTLRNDFNWFLLFFYVILVMIFIYKKKLFQNISQLLKDKIIDEDIYQTIRKSLIGPWAFLLLIIIFETAFFIHWFSLESIFNIAWFNLSQVPDISNGFSNIISYGFSNIISYGFSNIISHSNSHIISYVVIAVVVIPIGTRCFAILLEIAFLPWRLSKLRVDINIFHYDKKGGLGPIVELLFYGAAYVSGGIVITYYLYSELFTGENLVYYGSIFISLNLFIFFFPQIHIYTILSKNRNKVLNILHDKIAYWYNKLIDINDPEKQTENAEKYSHNVSPYQNTRDEVNRMQVWPFDWSSFKFLIQFTLSGLLLLVPSLVDYVEVFKKLFGLPS